MTCPTIVDIVMMILSCANMTCTEHDCNAMPQSAACREHTAARGAPLMPCARGHRRGCREMIGKLLYMSTNMHTH